MGRVITFIDAITEALDQEMARDERVYLIGEDIGLYGGVFKATKGLQKKYGEYRVIDSPISENLIVGAGIGAAMGGLRPDCVCVPGDDLHCEGEAVLPLRAHPLLQREVQLLRLLLGAAGRSP